MDARTLLARLGDKDAAELYSGSFDSLEVRFSAGELKNATAREASGIAVRAAARGKAGFASSRDTSPAGLERLIGFVDNSIDVGDAVRFELPEPAKPPVPPETLGGHDPAVADLEVAELAALGRQAVQELLARHPDVVVDASVRRSVGETLLLNHRGVEVADRHSVLSLSLEVNRTRDEDVLLDFDHAIGVRRTDVSGPALVEELDRRLRWGREVVSLRPGRMPVVFSPAGSLVVWMPLLQALNGKNVLLGTSPLRERTGERVLSERVTLIDDGLLPWGLASAAFDDEGVPRQTRPLLDRGVLRGFVHDLETAKGTGSEPTGNGERGGVTGKPGPGFSNLLVAPGERSWRDLVASVDYGLLVHSVVGLGQGNTLPGTFSNPVDLGYLIEGGEVRGRVKDVSIAGKVYELLADDLEFSRERRVLSGTTHLPWLRIGSMNVVGKGSA
ncbi:MAG: TldD/PmbA family protein [Planctomycetota bacterium]|nr:MAG: TldD/PmbA family protein [Planctomycetota bacterium]